MAKFAPSEFAAALLCRIADTASDSGLTLAGALKAAFNAQFSHTGTGRFLSGTTANGHSVTFSLGSIGDLTPEDVAVILLRLRRAHTASVAFLGDGATDAEIQAVMELRLAGVTEFETDFSLLSRT